MSRIVVKVMRADSLTKGPITLTVFKPADTKVIDSSKHDFMDVVAEYGERYRNDRSSMIIISLLDDKGNIVEESVIMGRGGSGDILFPGPARLEKIVAVRRTSGGGYLRDEYSVDEECYVYTGEIVCKDNSVEAVILVTDRGARPVSVMGVRKDSNGDR
jgi:hypothetical protein